MFEKFKLLFRGFYKMKTSWAQQTQAKMKIVKSFIDTYVLFKAKACIGSTVCHREPRKLMNDKLLSLLESVHNQ